ncbi:MAG TPA: formylglycine-generating enzyme family protein [Saprospiraceae bacterium]|nr:formylglycine-generating enzyme family protein [Saprospiraceae bacterium]
MKNIFTIIFLFLITGLTFSQKATPVGFVSIPDGEMEVGSKSFKIRGFYMMSHEVTNEEYAEFLKWYKEKNGKDELEMVKPVVSKKDLPLLPKSYLKSSKFAKYPVVGITRDIAEKYCEYLKDTHPENKGLFRLPFEREWIYAAQGGRQNYNYSCGNSLTGINNELLCNFKSNGTTAAPLPAISLKPNEFGLYNMSGNVAEWIKEEGRSKGGSWNDSPLDLMLTAKDPRFGHKEATAFTGFRVVWVGE